MELSKLFEYGFAGAGMTMLFVLLIRLENILEKMRVTIQEMAGVIGRCPRNGGKE